VRRFEKAQVTPAAAIATFSTVSERMVASESQVTTCISRAEQTDGCEQPRQSSHGPARRNPRRHWPALQRD
jgi:hypothetical protein